MIHEFVTIHDRFQFEIKQRLVFHPSEKQRRYVMETLFFIPNSLGINKETYTKQMFYSRLKNYIRLRIPTLPGTTAQDLDKAMIRIATALERLKQHKEGAGPTYRHAVKIYALMLKKELRQKTFKAKPLTGETLCRHTLETMETAVLGADLLRTHEHDQGKFLDEDSRRALAYCNEYISMCLAYYFFRIFELPAWDPGDKHQEKIRTKMIDRLHEEMAYQKQVGEASGPYVEGDNETLIYKWNILKKYVNSPLFLEIRRKKEGKIFYQLIYSLSAGLAMLFATTVAFIWQDTYGSMSTPLFIALVIGYIFKDRMKDAIRYILSNRLKKVLSDRQQFVYQNFSTLIGRCRENFYFISDSQIPGPIMKLRKKTHLVEVENSFRSENVMYYRKEILMKPRAIGQSWDGLVDITRLNISDFLTNMDDPKHTMFVLKENSYEKRFADKVYHMNMIRCHRIGDKQICKRFRIVFNRDGIKRIDHIHS